MAQKISRRILAKTMAEQLQGGADRRKVAISLAAYLIEHKMVNQLDMLLGDIAFELAQNKQQLHATVTSARALSASLKIDITTYLRDRYDTKKVEITEVIDPSIVGGVVIQTPNDALDLSIRAKLNRLQQA